MLDDICPYLIFVKFIKTILKYKKFISFSNIKKIILLVAILNLVMTIFLLALDYFLLTIYLIKLFLTENKE